MNNPKSLFLHCSATPEGKEFYAKDIRKWHKAQGWSDIGYHYVIDLDGSVEAGRDNKVVGAHCLGHNTNSLGICYIGGLASDGKTAKDTRTPQQKVALLELVHRLMLKYNIPLSHVYCHNQFARKACPSFQISTFQAEYKAKYK